MIGDSRHRHAADQAGSVDIRATCAAAAAVGRDGRSVTTVVATTTTAAAAVAAATTTAAAVDVGAEGVLMGTAVAAGAEAATAD